MNHGDGTINEVATGLLSVPECHTAVAVAPFGTANDFATGCGIVRDNPLAALQLAARGKPRKIDVGQVNDRYFVNVGGAAYSLMGLASAARMTLYKGKLVTPDGTHAGTMILMAVGNGRGRSFCPMMHSCNRDLLFGN